MASVPFMSTAESGHPGKDTSNAAARNRSAAAPSARTVMSQYLLIVSATVAVRTTTAGPSAGATRHLPSASCTAGTSKIALQKVAVLSTLLDWSRISAITRPTPQR